MVLIVIPGVSFEFEGHHFYVSEQHGCVFCSPPEYGVIDGEHQLLSDLRPQISIQAERQKGLIDMRASFAICLPHLENLYFSARGAYDDWVESGRPGWGKQAAMTITTTATTEGAGDGDV